MFLFFLDRHHGRHGLFDDDMSATPKLGQYQWYNADQVFDYLVSLGMKPVVELSFMPSAFVKGCKNGGDGSCSYAFSNNGGYKGLVMPPDDFEDWYNMVHNLTSHLVDRYGLDEIKTWHFEVWNEMWGVAFPDPYMSLYNASALAIKAVDTSLKVGGPATMQTLYIPDFIKATTKATPPIPVDFVRCYLLTFQSLTFQSATDPCR